jgi:hypothetical protein
MTRAIIFDFNGTLSDDEPVLCEIFIELFAEHGKPLSAQQYFDELAGLSDPDIVRTWLGEDYPNVDTVIAERVTRYRAAVGDRAPPVRRSSRSSRRPASLRAFGSSSRPTTSCTANLIRRATWKRYDCSTSPQTHSSSRTPRPALRPQRLPGCA